MANRPSPKHDIKFSILRVPFFLESEYPENLVSVGTNRERLLKKWGGKEGWEEQKRRHNLKGRGKAAGIPYFNLDRLTGNTMASHRLIQHVGKLYGLSVSEALYDRLNVYYFVDGHSLNDKTLLAKVAAEEVEKVLSLSGVGTHQNIEPLSEREILDFLNGNAGRKEIKKALRTLQRLGIHSIPKFIIEGQTLIDGAADWRSFVDVFSEIEERGEVNNEGKTVFGDILGVAPDLLEQGTFSS